MVEIFFVGCGLAVIFDLIFVIVLWSIFYSEGKGGKK